MNVAQIKNYFSDRIEEIKKGTFVPSWDQIKDLPEFKGTYRSDLINAQDSWYKETFVMSFKDFYMYLASGLSEEDYALKLIIKKLRLSGGVFFFIGVLSTLGAILVGNIINWSSSYFPGYFVMVACMSIGIILIIGGVILGILLPLSTTKMKNKIDSMSQSDLAKMFESPESGNKVVVHLIKPVGFQILVKIRYPPSGMRILRIPLKLKDQSIPYFQDAVFRCFKCGQKIPVDHVKRSGPWTLIRLNCPVHGYFLPYHKIWSTIYTKISREV